MLKSKKAVVKNVSQEESGKIQEEEEVKKLYKGAFIVKKRNKYCVYSHDTQEKGAKLLALSFVENDAWKKALHTIL